MSKKGTRAEKMTHNEGYGKIKKDISVGGNRRKPTTTGKKKPKIKGLKKRNREEGVGHEQRKGRE